MRPLQLLPTLGLIAVLAPVATSLLGTTSVPTDIQMPGTQPQEVFIIERAEVCRGCHGDYDSAVEPWYTWQGSMMSHATRDPLFWAAVAIAEQDLPGSGDLCLRCHTPTGWMSGRSEPTDGSALLEYDADGVNCDVCHRLTNTDNSEHVGFMLPPFMANDEDPQNPKGYYGSGMYSLWNDIDKLGPYSDAQTPHQFKKSNFHRDARHCGTCHDVSNPAVGDLAHNNGAQVPLATGTFNGTPNGTLAQKAAFNNFPHQYGAVERTFSEHQSSGFANLPVSQYTGLPPELKDGSIEQSYLAATAATASGNYVDGDVRTFSCQTCHMRPTTGKGCVQGNAPIRADLPGHRMVGGNYWAPQAIQWLDAQNKLVAGGGLTATQLLAMDAGVQAARDMLEEAASLDVNGDELTITNLTGHKLITGYPEGRRMWLRVKWFDSQGAPLREDGAYGDLAVTVDNQPLTVKTLLDLDDPNLRAYEAHMAMTQEWANQLLGFGTSPTLVLSYDRVSGLPLKTLGDLAAQPAGTHLETFHFALNNLVASDTRIPPYGFRYDDALERSALPVPPDQYGNPGPGGVYQHQDIIDLNPPAAAATAQIDLLYQPTSWEYIQFLHLANSGQVTFLDDTGQDLLDAWLATGMAEPHPIASASWSGTPATWADRGHGLPGIHGTPVLSGSGPLTAGSQTTLALSGALENSLAGLIVGNSQALVPFRGGTLVPLPGRLEVLGTDSNGEITLSAAWPGGMSPGTTLLFQYWIMDPVGPFGFSASNALHATTP